MNLPDSAAQGEHLRWLFALQRFGARAGLDTMRELLSRIGSPESRFGVTLVGGTNGKGSVASLLAAALGASGVKAGLFTSPHLQRVGERIKLAGSEGEAAGHLVSVTNGAANQLVGAVRGEAEAVGATFFEVITAAALLGFERAGVEHAVLEVGMGGRLDATNATEPTLTIITNVSVDHAGVLGATEAEIAREKAGILRPRVPLITGASGAALALITERAKALEVPLIAAGSDFLVSGVRNSWAGVELLLERRSLPAMRLRSRLVGRHQAENMALAAVAALQLGVPERALTAAFESVQWPGRLERFEYEQRSVVIDGAHNPAAARALALTLRELEGRVGVLILGVSDDKDAGEIVLELFGAARRLIFTRATKSPRSADPETLLALHRAPSGAAPAKAEGELAAALEAAVRLTAPGEVIVIAGSLFLAGEARDLLLGAEPEPFERWQ